MLIKKLKIGKKKILIDVWGFFLIHEKILLIGGKGNLGSTIVKSQLFKNISFPNKKKLNLLNKKDIKVFSIKKFYIIIN